MLWKVFARLPSNWKNAKDYARECYRGRLIAIGWNDIGDLNLIPNREKLRANFNRHYAIEAKNGARTTGQQVGELWAFKTKIHAGDYLICPDGNYDKYYVGIVQSDTPFYDKTLIEGKCDFANRREVKWIKELNVSEVIRIWPNKRFGGNQGVSKIIKGADHFFAYLKSKNR